jgi:hypothetical protein
MQIQSATQDYPINPRNFPPITKIPKQSLTHLMQETFLHRGAPNSLHARAVKLPYYSRLDSSKISGEELLLNLVNSSAIFKKIEELIKTHSCFKQIIAEELFRYPLQEKDIYFFIKNLNLTRPKITSKTQEFLNFIDEKVKEDPTQLLPILFVQYAGLFIGRTECNATITWLKKNIETWDSFPKDEQGVSFWNFKNSKNIEDLENRKIMQKNLLQAINKFGEDLERTKSGCTTPFPEIAEQAFKHNYKIIKSISNQTAPNQILSDKVFQVALVCLFSLACFSILNNLTLQSS